jgi:Proteasome-substrate-size regulator, mid region
MAFLTENQVKKIYAVCLKNMDLPLKNALPMKISEKDLIGSGGNFCQHFAYFLVYSFAADPSSKSNLQNLLHALEGFAHPSNSGKWSFTISNFSLRLSEALIKLKDEGKLE